MSVKRDVIVVDEETVQVVEVVAQGPPGPPGEVTALNSGLLFIGPNAPVDPPATYTWIQTGLGVDGDGVTFWIEDGQ